MRALLLVLIGCEHGVQHVRVMGPDGHVVEACNTGCSGPEAPVHHPDDEVSHHLAALAKHPVGAETEDLDALLFHGDETRDYLVRNGAAPLSPAWETWLRAELERDKVDIAFRLIAADGTLIGHHEDRFPFVERQEWVLKDTGALGRVSMNGKLKRVGVDHLWARF